MKECFVHELVSASLHKLPAYCGKWRGGAAEKLAKPRLVTDVDPNCGFLITPPLPTVLSIFQLCTLGLPAHGPKLYVHVCEIVKLKGKTLGL